MPGIRFFLSGGEVISFDRMKKPRIRANEQIRVPEIRVIGADGNQLGVLPTQEALRLAREQGLDLVEVSPTARPPVCRIMDFGKYKYEQSKKQKQSKKKQHTFQVKEVKFRPKTEEHDYQFKKKHIERFLAEGDKVKATVFFRGREMAHPEIGRRILERLIGELSDVAVAETAPRQEGNQMHTILGQKADKSARRGSTGAGAGESRRPAPVTAASAAGTQPVAAQAAPPTDKS